MNGCSMKTNLLLTLSIAALLSTACSERRYTVIEADNPVYHDNTAFNSFEDLRSQKCGRLKAKYQLDSIFKGEEDELQRIILFRDLIQDVIHIDDFGDPYPGGATVEGILDQALRGTGFH